MSRIRVPLSVLAGVYVPALAVLGLVALLSNQSHIPIHVFLNDPATTFDSHPLTGAQSTVGVLVWCATAVTCFFSAAILQRTHRATTWPSFFLWSGALTTILLLDDVFQFHENIGPLHLRIDEELILIGLAVALGVYLVRFRNTILSSDYLLLCLALAFFGVSMFLDNLGPDWIPARHLVLEDGAKFLGIVSWSGYLIRTCAHTVAAAVTAPSSIDRPQSPHTAQSPHLQPPSTTAKPHVRKEPNRLLILLICSDLLFIVLHLAHEKTQFLQGRRFSLDQDRGFAELFQYLKEYWIVLLLLSMALHRSPLLYVSWSLLFGYMLADDALLIHERLGLVLSERLGFQSGFRFQGEDFGELAVSGLVGLFLFCLIAVTYTRSDFESRQLSRSLFKLLAGLAGFGVLMHIVGVFFEGIAWPLMLGLIEEGGEMIMMSLIVSFVFCFHSRSKS